MVLFRLIKAKEVVLLITLAILISIDAICQSHNKKALRLFELGTDNVRNREYEKAVRNFSEALMIEPGFLEAYENRGVAKYYLKDKKGAIEDYTIALRINQNDVNTYGRRGWAR